MAFTAALNTGSHQVQTTVEAHPAVNVYSKSQGKKSACQSVPGTDLQYSTEQDVAGNISYLPFNTY